jgi:hypothetical protein
MSNLPDIDIRSSGDEAPPLPPAPKREAWWWIAAAFVVVAGSAAYFFYSRGSQPAPAVPATEVSSPQTAAPVSGREVEAIDLPPLDDTDPLVRELARGLSAHPRLAAWLATRGLIRNFTVVVENTSNGDTPARHLRILAPSAPFRAVERGGFFVVDPRSYQRYNDLADAAASLDTKGTVKLYETLRPRIDEAYRELGHQEPFDEALETAITMLLRAPAVDGEIRLESAGALYQYSDEDLEGLTDAQRQFLRMGPRNVRLIQGKLGEIALALGIPAERLPQR